MTELGHRASSTGDPLTREVEVLAHSSSAGSPRSRPNRRQGSRARARRAGRAAGRSRRAEGAAATSKGRFASGPTTSPSSASPSSRTARTREGSARKRSASTSSVLGIPLDAELDQVAGRPSLSSRRAWAFCTGSVSPACTGGDGAPCWRCRGDAGDPPRAYVRLEPCASRTSQRRDQPRLPSW